ncbi:MAG: hypothetical protein NW205_07520 [Hyphomicrobiaceae bacterium]|nr:hypothetical protein [Hyphomicrobiaceae bacterium]
MKALVPFFFFAAIRNKAWSQAAASALVWTVVTAYSLTSAFGHAALNRFDVASDRSAEKQVYQDLRADLARAKDQLSWVPEHRPAATVAAEIEGLKTNKVWKVTEGCTNVTGPQGRTLCQQYAGLQAEMASAEQATALEARIAATQQKLSGVDTAHAMSEADPQAHVLAKLSGYSVEQVQLAMVLFVAVLLEVGSGFGLYVAMSQWRLDDRRIPAAPKMVPVPVSTAAAAVAGGSAASLPVQIDKPRSGANDNANKVVASPAPQRLVAPESDVERYYKEKIETQDGSSVTATELFEDYCQWCEELQKEPLAFPKFSRDFGELGVQKARVAGRVRYIGVARKATKGHEEVKNSPVFGVKAA